MVFVESWAIVDVGSLGDDLLTSLMGNIGWEIVLGDTISVKYSVTGSKDCLAGLSPLVRTKGMSMPEMFS